MTEEQWKSGDLSVLSDQEAELLCAQLRQELVEECTREAGEALSGFEDREFLCWLAQLLAGREQ